MLLLKITTIIYKNYVKRGMEYNESSLTEAGLTGNEARVYLALLKEGSSVANSLAKRISMDRTLTYTVLNNLIDKGLVNFVKKDKKKYFSAADPTNLLNPLKEKEFFITNLITSLQSIKKVEPISYEVKVYEGKKGLRTFIEEASNTKEFLSFGSTGKMYDLIYELPNKVKEHLTEETKVRIITSKQYIKNKGFDIRQFQVRYLNTKHEATTSIFGDKVAIHLIKEKPFVIIIHNKEIAQSYKEYFEVLWKVAKIN